MRGRAARDAPPGDRDGRRSPELLLDFVGKRYGSTPAVAKAMARQGSLVLPSKRVTGKIRVFLPWRPDAVGEGADRRTRGRARSPDNQGSAEEEGGEGGEVAAPDAPAMLARDFRPDALRTFGLHPMDELAISLD